MAVALVGWAIGVFLFLKVAMDWVFEADITLTAALLIAALEGVAAVVVSAVHSLHLLNYDWAQGSLRKGFQAAIGKTAVLLTAILLAEIVFARLIIFEFSKDLSREVQNFCRSDCIVHDTILWFGAIVATPLLIQYAGCVLGTYRAVRRP